MNRKTLLLSLRVKTVASHPVQDIYYDRSYRKDYLGDKDGVPPNFKKKVSLNHSDWSLTIYNLQENDSGLYEALSHFEDETLAAFTLTVENIVSQPVIKLSPFDFNSSAGVCRATVNCSADGSWAMYDCDQSHCAETQASQFSINISVTALDRGIQCHVNNHVSKNHSKASNIMCLEKQQSESPSSPSLVFWIMVTTGGGILLSLILGLIVIVLRRRKCSKIHPQSSRVVIEQHHETIYSTVDKPAASQISPENNTVSDKVETIYDTPSRHTKACQVDSVEVRSDNQEQQQSHDRTIQVKATVHQAAEADSEPINTVYCKLGEI
ncbi:SLAM family member 9-like protein [Labeo rohita]|uniref:SLAM family member 9-like protein n=1 Tax=Labeo rohita TaxID=84645 RepID=A0A498MFW6_LABRO|nr:SLAM family member 9-like protein [Labeo rohita]